MKKQGLITIIILFLIVIGATSYIAGAYLKSKTVKPAINKIIPTPEVTKNPEVTVFPTVLPTTIETQTPTETPTPTITIAPTIIFKLPPPVFKLIPTATPTPTPKLLQIINKNVIQFQK